MHSSLEVERHSRCSSAVEAAGDELGVLTNFRGVLGKL
jgi:hypothetical protein